MTYRTPLIVAALVVAALSTPAAFAQARVDTRPSPFTYEALGATPSIQLKSLKADAKSSASAGKSTTEVDATKAAPLTWNPKAQDTQAAKTEPAPKATTR